MCVAICNTRKTSNKEPVVRYVNQNQTLILLKIIIFQIVSISQNDCSRTVFSFHKSNVSIAVHFTSKLNWFLHVDINKKNTVREYFSFNRYSIQYSLVCKSLSHYLYYNSYQIDSKKIIFLWAWLVSQPTPFSKTDCCNGNWREMETQFLPTAFTRHVFNAFQTY